MALSTRLKPMRLMMLLLPAAAIALSPLVYYLGYRPSLLWLAAVSAAAVSALLLYAILLLMWRDIMRPIRRYCLDLRYRWATRHLN